MINRRQFLYSMAGTAGALAVPQQSFAGPLDPKKGHLPAKAKRVIMLFMEGAPSHMDTLILSRL